MAFTTLQQKVGKQVKAVRQYVKLQLLISGAGECIFNVYKCIIKEIVSATTGGQRPGNTVLTELSVRL